MADFEKAYKKTAINEGGYTDNPDDGGNWTGGKKGLGNLVGTNYGISAPVLAAHLRRIPTVQDMLHISIETVKGIYKANYWNRVRGDDIKDQTLAEMVYDSAVNMGVRPAIVLAQRSAGISETGIMDTLTLNKLNNESSTVNSGPVDNRV